MANRSSRIANIASSRKRNNSHLEYQRYEPKILLAADFSQLPQNDLQLVDQLAVRQDTAWLQQGLNQLTEVASESNGVETTTVFQQSWNGLPVSNSWLTVVQDVDGNITNVRDHAKPNIQGYATDADPIDATSATKIASTGLGTASNLNSDAHLAWYYAGNKARLSWLVETTVLDSNGESAGEFDTWVNVFDGQIFDREIRSSAVEDLLSDPLTETGVFPRIVINDAIGAVGSRDYAAPFDAVVSISVGCTGTLISANTVISARHCGISTNSSVSFGDNSNNPDATFGISAVSNPAGGNANSSLLDGGDVSILTLSSNVPASVATPMRFIDATNDLVGLTAVTVGYGYNGVGSSGHGFTADGRRWGGENVIDAYGSPSAQNGSNIISTDFDDGSNGANTIGGSSSTPLEFEATTAPGDSGGPVLVDVNGEWVIAGVLSGGTTNTSVYGDISWWTGTAVYRSQIENAGGLFIGDGAGSVDFGQASYFVGDSIEGQVRDGNAVGDVTVTITSDSGDSETLTVSPTSAGNYSFSIGSAGGAAVQNDGTLQIDVGDEIEITYSDVDDGDGNTVSRTDTATISQIGAAALIGVDFDSTPNAPVNWFAFSGDDNSGTSDLGNEEGGASDIDLTINGGSSDFAVSLNTNTIPQHTNSIANIDGQIFTGGDSIEFVYSELLPSTDYFVYVFSAEGFFDTIEQTVSIQGSGAAVSFEQRFNQDDLFINDQLGDSSRELSEYAQVITASASGEISINIDPIAGTEDVVVAGLAIFKVPEAPITVDDTAVTDENVSVTIDVLANDTDPDGDAFSVDSVSTAANGSVSINGDGTVEYTPNLDFTGTDSFTYTAIDSAGNSSVGNVAVEVTEFVPAVSVSINSGEVERSMINELEISFDGVVTLGSGAFELIQRGPGGGSVNVTPTIDNSSGQSVVTLTFSGAFVDADSGSLADGNYQLTINGDQITTSSGNTLDADDDGTAGGSSVFGDTAADNFFRFYGDANGDRNVNVFDLLELRQTFGESIGDAAFDEQFDFNGDGTINVFDLLGFRQNFQEELEFV